MQSSFIHHNPKPRRWGRRFPPAGDTVSEPIRSAAPNGVTIERHQKPSLRIILSGHHIQTSAYLAIAGRNERY